MAGGKQRIVGRDRALTIRRLGDMTVPEDRSIHIEDVGGVLERQRMDVVFDQAYMPVFDAEDFLLMLG